ncbi:MAG: rod shape-determining protein MreD [Bacteroidales bacterium]
MLIRNVIRFVVLVLFQVLVINNIAFNSYIYPAFYVYFILLLPFETPGWLLLMSAFMLGLSVDFFTNSLGVNAAATVFVAFLRPAVFRLLKSKKEYEPGIIPGIRDLGFRWFFFYALILILIHHSTLFLLEVFSLKHLTQTLNRIAFSSGVTLLLTLLAQFVFLKQDKK